MFIHNMKHLPFTGSILYQAQQAGPTLGPSVRQMKSSSPSPPPFQQPEPFVPPEELEIPPEMEIVSIIYQVSTPTCHLKCPQFYIDNLVLSANMC